MKNLLGALLLFWALSIPYATWANTESGSNDSTDNTSISDQQKENGEAEEEPDCE